MRRLQLVELEDLAWWPAPWRDAGTAFLAKTWTVGVQAKLVREVIGEALERSGEREILDLCSGGGGPIRVLLDGFGDVRVRLTDKFPNLRTLDAVAAGSDGRVEVVRESVDATAVPAGLPGLRTMFNALHHLPPAVARGVLASAVRDGRAIAVVEPVGRHPAALIGMIFVPLAFALVLPFLRPFRWSWLFWTYAVPVLPAFVLFDGYMSCFRVYSPAELREMTASIDAPGWTWDIREVALAPGGKATVLLGLPPA